MIKMKKIKRREVDEAKRGKELVQRLIKIIEKRGLTQDEASQHIGVSWVTVNRWINMHRTPKHLYADALEEFLTKYGG